MPGKPYKCTNFANCDKALTKELIEIGEGEDFACPSSVPDCQAKYLQPAARSEAAAATSLPKPLLFGAAGLLVVALVAFFLWPSQPDPELANTMITDYFPRLK